VQGSDFAAIAPRETHEEGGFVQSRRIRFVLLGVASLVIAGLAALGAVAIASPALPIVTSTPQHADQMTNVDVLKQQIKNYYALGASQRDARRR
jgi:hypothetical protein